MWSKNEIMEWYERQPWIVGFNYVTSNAVNSIEMWQEESFSPNLIRKELMAAAELGYNSCRIFLQYILWKSEKRTFLKNFEIFLHIANECGLTVMPVLFDDCAFSHKEPYLGKQDYPIKGVHNSGWTPSPGFRIADDKNERPFLKEYVSEIIESYKKDRRILLWDLYNEPGNSNRNEKCLSLLEDSFNWARLCEADQPLTAGIWAFRDFDMECAGLSDIITFHDYTALPNTKKRVEELLIYGKPMICTEWMNRIADNRIDTHLSYYKDKRIGVFNWGLVKGKTQTYLSWDAEENCIDGEPKIWQHDIFFDNLEPYSKLEAGIIKELTQNENIKIRIPIREMTHELMDELENKGLILRLYPSHHRNIVDLDKSVGKDIYISSKKAGAHKLLSVTINRTDFSAFGMHDENEEVLLIGGEGEKDLFILFGLGTWDSFMKKKKEKTLCEDDFICVHCKYNDPFVSFFTICKGVLHGEAVAGEMGMPATFYVTEPSDIKLMIFPFNNYKITF